MRSTSSSDLHDLLVFLSYKRLNSWIEDISRSSSISPVGVLSSILFLPRCILGYNFSCRQSPIIADNFHIESESSPNLANCLRQSASKRENWTKFNSRSIADQSQTVCDHLRSNCVCVHKNSTRVCSGLRLLIDFMSPRPYTAYTCKLVSSFCKSKISSWTDNSGNIRRPTNQSNCRISVVGTLSYTAI